MAVLVFRTVKMRCRPFYLHCGMTILRDTFLLHIWMNEYFPRNFKIFMKFLWVNVYFTMLSQSSSILFSFLGKLNIFTFLPRVRWKDQISPANIKLADCMFTYLVHIPVWIFKYTSLHLIRWKISWWWVGPLLTFAWSYICPWLNLQQTRCIVGNATGFDEGRKNAWNKNDISSSAASIVTLFFVQWIWQCDRRAMLNWWSVHQLLAADYRAVFLSFIYFFRRKCISLFPKNIELFHSA